MTVRHTRPYGFVSKVPASFPVLPLEKAKAYEALAKRRGASKVARSSRGFFAAFKRAGGHVTTMGKDPQFGQDWGRRRRAFLKRHMAQIRYCYQRELTKDPSVKGKIVIKFVIAKDGSVSSANTKTTTMNSPSVENCIVSRFMRMQFPEPKGGGIVIVSYPFIFSAG